jgi:hypothetical protein
MMQTRLCKAFTPTAGRYFFGVVVFLLFFGFAAAEAQAADAPIAEVLTIVPGATVNRNGQTLPLEKFSPLHLSDTVSTDATGRVKILFNDDSIVSVGSNTSLDLRDFADSGASSVFNVRLLQGVARVITGRIVEQNPQGFAVSTPEGIIGIRGTIISLRTGGGATTVYVENTTRAVYVNNIDVPGGHKITIPGDTIQPEPILPQDRRNLGRDLALRGGNGVAAAAPEPVMDSGRPEEQLRSSTRLAARAGLLPPDTPLAGVPLSTQSLGDSLMAGGGGGGGGGVGGGGIGGGGGLTVTPIIAGYAYSSGGLAAGSFTYLDFGFEMDLTSGAIFNGYMNGEGTYSSPTSFNLTGGTGGTLDAMNQYPIQGFTGTPHDASDTWIRIASFTPGDSYAYASVHFKDTGSSPTDGVVGVYVLRLP